MKQLKSTRLMLNAKWRVLFLLVLLIVVLFVTTSCSQNTSENDEGLSIFGIKISGGQDSGQGDTESKGQDGAGVGQEETSTGGEPADGTDQGITDGEAIDASNPDGTTMPQNMDSTPPTQTGSDEPNADQPQAVPDPVEPMVYLSVQRADGSFVVEKEPIKMKAGDSVLDVLIRAGKDLKFSVVFSGAKKSAYISGIDNLFEFDQGPESGWTYWVNGEKPLKSCGSFAVAEKDDIVWRYATTLGEGLE
jgi:hypothetical protein